MVAWQRYLIVSDKEYVRKTMEPYVLLQIRLKKSDRQRLREIAAQVGMTANEFIKRLLQGKLNGKEED